MPTNDFTTRIRIHCQCSSCKREQNVPIQWIFNTNKCRSGIFGKPCGGDLIPSATTLEKALQNAMAMLHYLNQTTLKNDTTPIAQLADSVADDIATRFEAIDDPQQMGWVGQDGLP